jgi:hypothetical protein
MRKPAPKRITAAAIERRLLELLKPLVEKQGGLCATLEEVGESGAYGLALTFEGGEAYDLRIQEARQ